MTDAPPFAVASSASLSGAERRRRLADARLYVCTDARPGEDIAEFASAAFGGGVDIIQVRDKTIEAADEIAALTAVAAAARGHGAMFAVNDRADVAALVGADVFHIGQRDLTPGQARGLLGPDVLIGRSTHAVEQIDAAESDPDVDYFCVGPVWETPTKPGRDAVGIDVLRYAAAMATKPWFAIGGIAAGDRLDAVLAAGAERVVVVRAVTRADDPAAAARELRARLG
ncbi:thiamine-phosphate diphosphorylase [Aeromicrobium sp. PE09-221]|uniref:thiamine phosphate synthase n=1 Tax=Aeromicrobium sp. PE09-221 TaxID=1898043 RepID=UPI000B3E4A46|nr:thiamine phosphate synthase [Aeromicrobium sp. PE09-221]OUZ12765.1 thiamine-phosphate diphosphorylase [Aeromicrobium sp. PE09-221]